MPQLIPWCKTFLTPTSWSVSIVAVLHSLFIPTLSMSPWQQLVFGAWADASDPSRPDGSRTGGYVITLDTEQIFGHGQEDDVAVMAWRSFKLTRKIAGSNDGETQAPSFADESLWLAQLAWSQWSSRTRVIRNILSFGPDWI